MFAVLLQVVALLVIVGVILWALTQFNIDATIAKLIRVVIVVVVTIWVVMLLLGLAGMGSSPLLRR